MASAKKLVAHPKEPAPQPEEALVLPVVSIAPEGDGGAPGGGPNGNKRVHTGNYRAPRHSKTGSNIRATIELLFV